MNSKSLRVAVVGAGRWGNNIVKTLAALPACTVAYVVTSKTHGAVALHGTTPALLTDYQELLRTKDFDAVLIATPGSTHARIALPFITRSIPTFIEKPLALSLRDAQTLVRAAKKYKTAVVVGHIHLFNPGVLALKKLLPSLGTIHTIEAQAGGNGPFRDDMSVLWDWAPHDVAVMMDLVGSMPTSVRAWGSALLRPKTTLYDTVRLELTFPGGIVGCIANSWIAPQKHKKIEVIGGRSAAVFDDLSQDKVTLYKNLTPKKISRGGMVSLLRQEPEVTSVPVSGEQPLALELAYFLEAARKRPKMIRSSIEDGLRVVQVLAAAEKSIAGNGRVIRL